jgi:phosphoribosyl 1,2-cyclic phosphodiesterase
MSKINFLHSVIFLGTGASSSLPNVLCITREKSGCKVCPSALTEEGKRNRRRNCSLLVRWYDGEGKLR